MSTRLAGRIAALLVAVATAGGCGGGGDGSVEVNGEIVSEDQIVAEEEAEAASRAALLDDLRAVVTAYGEFWSDRGTDVGPQDVEDLAPFLSDNAEAISLIRRGEIVVCWNAALRDISHGAERTVLAYARQVPLYGGPVGFADTGVREVPAHEFAGLAKASPSR